MMTGFEILGAVLLTLLVAPLFSRKAMDR